MRDPDNTTSAFYPNTVIDAVIERTAKGEALTAICATPGYPSRASWWRWCTSDPQLSARYTVALQQSIARRRNLDHV
ncbi:terminase small subunit-like protein [Paraburkholderia sp. D1E]|uniref:terminase small subunit-like protein n=1 Tax=Paraburkholderia sp. D1E TaxID=3461398 RepID=UPI004045BB4C